MTRSEIQDRLDAIISDVNPKIPKLNMRDDIMNYLHEDELEEFYDLLVEEFGLDAIDLLGLEPTTFFLLVEHISAEIN